MLTLEEASVVDVKFFILSLPLPGTLELNLPMRHMAVHRLTTLVHCLNVYFYTQDEE